MSKNTIRINGDKLRFLLEDSTGKTIREIALENGFSKNLISEAIRQGKASPIVQNIAKLYGFKPEAYKLEEDTKVKEPAQMSIDDIALNISRDELKDLIIEAIREAFNGATISRGG